MYLTQYQEFTAHGACSPLTLKEERFRHKSKHLLYKEESPVPSMWVFSMPIKGLILNCFQIFPYLQDPREKVIYHLYAIRYRAGAGGMFFLCFITW